MKFIAYFEDGTSTEYSENCLGMGYKYAEHYALKIDSKVKYVNALDI